MQHQDPTHQNWVMVSSSEHWEPREQDTLSGRQCSALGRARGFGLRCGFANISYAIVAKVFNITNGQCPPP